MKYYKLNKNLVLRFEFFGGLLYSTIDGEEYELDFPTTIFLKSIEQGFSKDESFEIVNELIKEDYEINFDEFIEENILRETTEGNNEKNKNKYIKKLKDEIDNVKQINHLSFPIQVSLYLNSTCQLNCKFCFYNEKRKTFKEINTKEKWVELIKKLKEYGLVYLSILGGEPTLYSDIDEILRVVDDLKIKTTITTNGYRVKETTLDLISNSKYITPTISLQSVSDPTNKSLMGIESSYAMTTIEKFLSKGKKPRINTVITNQTEKEICDIVDYCIEKKIPDFYVDVYVDNHSNNNLRQRTFKEYREIKENVERYIISKNYQDKIFFQLQGCVFYSAYPESNEIYIETAYEKIKYGCEAGNTKIEIMPNGDVYPCVMFGTEQYKYDNCFQKDIKDIWYNSDYINELRNYRCQHKKCQNCKFYEFCNGGCPALILRENKSIISDADNRCQILKGE